MDLIFHKHTVNNLLKFRGYSYVVIKNKKERGMENDNF